MHDVDCGYLFWGIVTLHERQELKRQKHEGRKEKKRLREQARRRRQGKMTREEYLAKCISRRQPWQTEGISRRTWYRRRAKREEI